MIVPRIQLLLTFIFICIPGITLMGTGSGYSPYGLLACSFFALLLMYDFLVSWRLPSHITIAFDSNCYLTNNIPGSLSLTVSSNSSSPLSLCIGIMLPENITTSSYRRQFTISPEQSTLHLEWPCIPRQRGRFHLTNCRFEVASRLHFLSFRKTLHQTSEIRVYPDLRKEYQQLAGFFLNRGVEGSHAWKMIGKGREFEKLREYVHGDSYGDIHWKTTAKRHRPVTKIYQIERTQHIYTVLDKSRWSNKALTIGKKAPHLEESSTEETTCLERYIAASLVLASAAQRQGDCYGLLTFSNQLDSFVKASRGPSHYNLFRDALYNLKADDVNPDFHDVIAHIRLKVRRRSFILFLTNLDEPVLSEEYLQSISLISKKHLVSVGIILEYHSRPLFSEKVQSLDDIYDHIENHMAWHNLHKLEQQLKMHGVRMIRFTGRDICKQLVSTYLSIKQRQLI